MYVLLKAKFTLTFMVYIVIFNICELSTDKQFYIKCKFNTHCFFEKYTSSFMVVFFNHSLLFTT